MAANSLKATLPSLQSTKVPREPIPITENEGEKNFPALRAELPSLQSINQSITLMSRWREAHLHIVQRDLMNTGFLSLLFSCTRRCLRLSSWGRQRQCTTLRHWGWWEILGLW